MDSVMQNFYIQEKVDVLQIRDGIANRIQIFNTRSGCITAESEMYAHRSRPSLLVQDLRLHNPTRSEVALGLDQILASGWKDAKTSSESAVNTIGTSVSYTLTWGLIKIDALAEDLLYVGVAIASTNIKDKTLLWQSGFSISYSLAADALNGDKINSTIYYVLSNVPAPLHDPKTNPEVALDLKKTLHYPDQCYKEHTSLHSGTLWADAYDEDRVEGVLQAMLLSIGSLHFGDDHLEMRLHPKDTHRDFNFHRINYGNNTHMNISVLVGENNKANIFQFLFQVPCKVDGASHCDTVSPAHEHHVIALHKHGHHFGGLPTIFWVSIAFLITVFHLFLFKLIYNEYCQAQDRYSRSRYNL
ncbi:K2013-like protein [Mya arenaria]|uniref:K2013-like protein n=1 Tax=Mya arenaria TaxID=6604 RepID=A0ABY7E3I4_MYAAR|nr:K2013-like protein [Mya arenaria]